MTETVRGALLEPFVTNRVRGAHPSWRQVFFMAVFAMAATESVETAVAQSDGVELVSHLDLGTPEAPLVYADIWGYSAPLSTTISVPASRTRAPTIGTPSTSRTHPAIDPVATGTS